jgi:hypothetical protein
MGLQLNVMNRLSCAHTTAGASFKQNFRFGAIISGTARLGRISVARFRLGSFAATRGATARSGTTIGSIGLPRECSDGPLSLGLISCRIPCGENLGLHFDEKLLMW